MQNLIINGKNLGPVKARRQDRIRKQWVFLMDGGYFVSVDWMNMNRFDTWEDLEIQTYEEVRT